MTENENNIANGTEESVSAVFPTVASAEAAMRPFFGRKGTAAFFRMRISYMRMATKQRSWRNLREIPKRI